MKIALVVYLIFLAAFLYLNRRHFDDDDSPPAA